MSHHFNYDTDALLACSCCQAKGMEESFLEIMDEIREEVGTPLFVTSGYRCPIHNYNVSSTGTTGPHTTGRAIDIRCTDSRLRYKLTKAGLDRGMRVTPAKSFIHFDDLNNHPDYDKDVMWWYS